MSKHFIVFLSFLIYPLYFEDFNDNALKPIEEIVVNELHDRGITYYLAKYDEMIVGYVKIIMKSNCIYD